MVTKQNTNRSSDSRLVYLRESRTSRKRRRNDHPSIDLELFLGEVGCHRTKKRKRKRVPPPLRDCSLAQVTAEQHWRLSGARYHCAILRPSSPHNANTSNRHCRGRVERHSICIAMLLLLFQSTQHSLCNLGAMNGLFEPVVG